MKCSGKTSVGLYLKKHFHFSHLDTDAIIEKNVGEKVRSFYKTHGREAFKKAEYEAFKNCFSHYSLKNEKNDIIIISCGGGIAENEMVLKFLSEQKRQKKHLIKIFFLHLPKTILFWRIIKRAKKETSLPAFLECKKRLENKGSFWNDKKKLKILKNSFFKLYNRRIKIIKEIDSIKINTKGKTIKKIARSIKKMIAFNK